MDQTITETASEAALLFKKLVGEITEEFKTISNGRGWEEFSQSERRLYTRSVFALIEALIFVMKQMALSFHPEPDCETISQAERVFAQEQVYRLSESGDIEVHRNKVTLETNIKFSFKLFAKSGYVSATLDVSGSEWQALKKAIKVRDRITHPKKVADIEILDHEFEAVRTSLSWLTISFAKVFTDIGKKSLLIRQVEAKTGRSLSEQDKASDLQPLME